MTKILQNQRGFTLFIVHTVSAKLDINSTYNDDSHVKVRRNGSLLMNVFIHINSSQASLKTHKPLFGSMLSGQLVSVESASTAEVKFNKNARSPMDPTQRLAITSLFLLQQGFTFPTSQPYRKIQDSNFDADM